MLDRDSKALKDASPYGGDGNLTKGQFLFYETRTVATLFIQGLSDAEIVDRVVSENLFQYPTERSLREVAKICLARLRALGSFSLVEALTTESPDAAKQICLYAIMKKHRLVRDFMLTVVGEKFRVRDYSFGKTDVNVFFDRLQNQDDWVATWSDSTVVKIKQVLKKILVENEYLDNPRSERLKPVLLYPLLERAIRLDGDESALPAFNRFSREN